MNKNPLLLPASIIIAGIIIAGAVMYKPTTQTAVVTEKKLDYVELAGTLGLDTVKFKTCVDTHEFKEEILKDQADGATAGVSGTPTAFINGIKVEGAQPYSEYKKVIDEQLAIPAGAKRFPNPPGTDAEDDAILGDTNASVTMVIFGDYQCPYCGQAYRTGEKKVRDEYVASGKVKMVYRDYPLNFHPAAMPAAEAAQCAGAQRKYWQYHDALFDNQDRL